MAAHAEKEPRMSEPFDLDAFLSDPDGEPFAGRRFAGAPSARAGFGEKPLASEPFAYEPWDEPEEPDETLDLPDFVRPDYPFDLPPYRQPFYAFVFTQVGAHETCPRGACRRYGECQGGAGPPCFRADRRRLHKILLLVWLATRGLDTRAFNAALDRILAAPHPRAARRRRRGRGPI
jgi:hypothetical protein